MEKTSNDCSEMYNFNFRQSKTNQCQLKPPWSIEKKKSWTIMHIH